MSEVRSSSARASASSQGRRRRHGSGPAAVVDPSAVTPPTLLRRYSLPLAAYFHSSEAPPGLDTSQPLLLYRSYDTTKIRAASLQINADHSFLPVGPTLVIPDSYTGWFTIVTGKGRSSASFYVTIDEVAKAKPSFFLTRFEIPVYVKEVDPSDGDRISYRRITVQGGHVLKLLGIFEDLNSKKPLGESGCVRSKYIQCLNHCNQIIYVPFYVTGRFFETAHKGSTNLNHVFLISQILSSFHLPLNVRLVCGFMPRVPPAFTGLLRLDKVKKEAVILACTITSEARATLLEMDIESDFVLRPVADPLYAKTPIFLKSVSYCSDEAESWQRQIKVIHHVTENEAGSSLPRCTNTQSSAEMNISFFGDSERIRGREKEGSRTRIERGKSPKFRDKSRDVTKKSVETDKENRQKDNEESRFRVKVMDKLQDISRNRQYVANGEFIAIRPGEKLSGKKAFDNRKVSKQNTYIFQNEKFLKHHEKRRTFSETEATPSCKSVENQEYAIVLDAINYEKEEFNQPCASDTQYAEICDGKTVSVSDSRSGVVKIVNRRSNITSNKN